MGGNRAFPAFAVFLLLNGCSGERGGPLPAPSPAQGKSVASDAMQNGGGPSHGGETAPPPAGEAANSLPQVRSVRFLPGDAGSGTGLAVEAQGYDADGDPVRFEISWRKNGMEAGGGNRLAVPVRRGDNVTVTITPFDGKDRGRPAVLSREVLNTPPLIEGQEQFHVGDDAVTFLVRASDVDGDPLTYSLKDAPGGMVIDRKTGWVRWVTPAGATGKVPFTVVVSDGSGGESTARFTVTIAEQPSNGVR